MNKDLSNYRKSYEKARAFNKERARKPNGIISEMVF